MADDVEITAGTGTIIRADEVGGAKYQVVKVAFGADGSASMVASGAPLPVTSVVTAVTPGTSAANLGKAEDAAHASGDTGVMALAVRSDTPAATGADGDYVPLLTNSSGALYVAILGNPVLGAGTNAIGKLSANSGVDIGDVDVTSLPSDTFVAEDGSLGKGILIQGDDGTDRHNIQTDTNGYLMNVGVAADDAAVSGAPLLIAGNAVETDGTDPTSVSAEGDVATVRTTRDRRMLVSIASPRGFDANDNQSTAQTNTVLKAAPGSGLSLYITGITCSCTAANTIKFVEDPAGTPVTKVPVLYFADKGGCNFDYSGSPIRLTANKALGYTSTVAAGHSVMVTGFIAP